MAAESNVNKWQNLLNCVIFSKSLPDFWDPCVDRVTYGLINELFDFIDQNNLSSSVIKPSISLLCGVDDVSDIIKNVFNLKTSVKNLLKKKPQEISKIYPKLYPSSVVKDDNFTGKNCCMLGIDLSVVDLCVMFANLILRLSSGNVKVNADSARYYIGLLKKTHAKKLQTPLTKRGTGISDFLSSRFEIMSSSSNLECSGHEEVLNSSTSEIEELLSNSLQLEESRLNVSNLSRSLYTENKCVRKLKWRLKKINNKLSRVQKKNELLSNVQRINLSLSKEIKEVRKENENISLALIKKNKKLSKLNARNINKRLRTRDDTTKKLQANIFSKDKELADQKKKLSLSKRLKQMSAKETSLRTKVWYWKRAARNKISKP